MAKPGIAIEIPGFGTLEIRTVVSDYTGTLSCRGKLSPGVRECILMLQEWVDIHVVSADSFGTATQELSGLLTPTIMPKDVPHDVWKQKYVNELNPAHVAAFGNGNNDRLMLKAVKDARGLAVAVDNGEGCATDALLNSNLLIHGAADALTLLLIRSSCKATLRS